MSTTPDDRDRDPEPIPLEATATLDYSTAGPPITVSLELPGDVVGDPELATEAVTIQATVDE